MGKKLYENTIKKLYNLTPGLIKYNLNNIKILMKLFNNPQDKIKTIHIAGTNGKTSTSIILSNILKKLNYKVGTFISPHLKNFEERYKINLKNIPKKNLLKEVNLIFEKVKEYNKNKIKKLKPSFFELSTCIAFNYFFKKKVDFAIIETGMGGRLDATNIIKKPILSIITSISKDHQKILGNTIEKIAKEKSKIIKEKSKVLVKESSKTKKIFSKEAKTKNSKIYFFDTKKEVKILEENLKEQIFSYKKKTFKTNLLGEKEIENILCSIKAIELIKKKN